MSRLDVEASTNEEIEAVLQGPVVPNQPTLRESMKDAFRHDWNLRRDTLRHPSDEGSITLTATYTMYLPLKIARKVLGELLMEEAS